MTKSFVNSVIINGTETQIQDYGRDQPNGVPVLDPQGKLPTKYIPDNVGGESAPVGTLISQYKKVQMSGYLYCDGSTFDQNTYPALYMYLGTNVLPDYRECVMVGAEQNTTDTIATHDVYGEGEFKDDQLQGHVHSFNVQNTGSYTGTGSVRIHSDGLGAETTEKDTNNVKDARSGTTTHGKQKAVYVYIKATSGLAENQQENVLNDVKGYVDGSIDKMHPTIDISKVFSNGLLNVYTLYDTYGEGRYILLGQGYSGHSASTIDIWTLGSGAIACIITTSYSNNTLGVASLLVSTSSQNITINNEYTINANYMKKVC